MTLVKSSETNKKRVFRSCWDNKGWTEEKVVYPPRIADSSQHVPMKDLLAKYARGERLVGFQPVHDVPADAKVEDVVKAVDEMPLTRLDGFDPAHGSEAIRRGKEAFKSLRDKSKASKKDPAAAKTPDTSPEKGEAQ